MSWSKLKVALLTATTMLPMLAWTGCISTEMGKRIIQYVAVGSIFD